MDITVELESDVSLELGQWEDLEYLVDLLNHSWEAYEYKLEKIPGKKDHFLFIEDPLKEDSYECGIVVKKGKTAYAFSRAVYDLVMGAYQKYKEEYE